MAWMSDEEYLLMQDTRDKKITARSARSTRTHNGKRGAVKFPSDFMSKKELKAMNGPVETYRMNSPISWEEFKSYPDEHKVTYIKLLREKFNVPDSAIAEMFGVAPYTLNRWFKCLGLCKGAGNGKKVWNKEGFLAWRSGAKGDAVKASETPVEEVVEDPNEKPVEEVVEDPNETPVEEVVEDPNETPVEEVVEDPNETPVEEVFNMEHANDAVIITAEELKKTCETVCAVPTRGEMSFDGNIHDILRTVGNLLQGKNVRLSVTWECIREGDVCKKAE